MTAKVTVIGMPTVACTVLVTPRVSETTPEIKYYRAKEKFHYHPYDVIQDCGGIYTPRWVRLQVKSQIRAVINGFSEVNSTVESANFS